MADPIIAIAAAARPYPGEEVNGDAWWVDSTPESCRIAVVDGLGHGPQAAAASEAATSVLAAHPALDLTSAIQECHEALKGTRGAAMLVLHIDLPGNQLTFAGVGNVEAQLWQGGRSQHLISDRGIVGSTMPRIRPVTVALGPEWLLLVYTDGIRNRFEVSALQQAAADIDGLAGVILADWSRSTDDATVLVAWPR